MIHMDNIFHALHMVSFVSEKKNQKTFPPLVYNYFHPIIRHLKVNKLQWKHFVKSECELPLMKPIQPTKTDSLN